MKESERESERERGGVGEEIRELQLGIDAVTFTLSFTY
jgi:hypothetical protein